MLSNITKTKERAKFLLLGVILGLMLVVPNLYSIGYFDPVPYGRVERVRLEITPEDSGKLDITYQANFYKYDTCTYTRLVVKGYDLGEWVTVDASDPTGGQGDREEGWQTLTLKIVGKPAFSKYEIRLEHYCGPDYPKQTTVFDTFHYEEILQDIR